MDDTPQDDLLTVREVARFFGGSGKPLDKSTIYRWVRENRLPQPIRISRNALRWKRSELQAILDAAAAQRVQP